MCHPFIPINESQKCSAERNPYSQERLIYLTCFPLKFWHILVTWEEQQSSLVVQLGLGSRSFEFRSSACLPTLQKMEK